MMLNLLSNYNHSILSKVEVDILKITDKCIRACDHCSQNPEKGMNYISVKQFNENIDNLVRIKEETGNNILADYILTSTDSDPFLHPELAQLTKTLYEKTSKKFYFLTSGWYNHNNFQKNADWIFNNSEYVEKVALTLSNFPTNPSSIFNNVELLVNAVRTFGNLPKNKFVISPQYTEGLSDYHIHSKKQVEDLLNYVINKAGYNKNHFEGRICYRSIIGLGRANSKLDVKEVKQYRIEAEDPLPIISTREEERPYSGLIDFEGDLLIIEAPRAILNRSLKDYVNINYSSKRL